MFKDKMFKGYHCDSCMPLTFKKEAHLKLRDSLSKQASFIFQ